MIALTLLIVVALFANADACSSRRRPPPPPVNAPGKPKDPPPIVTTERVQEQKVEFNVCKRRCEVKTTAIDASGNEIEQMTLKGECSNGPPAGSSSGSYGSGAAPLEDDSPVAPPPGWMTNDGKNRCVGASDCVYECKFRVYAEVALTIISKPTGCGCAFHLNIVNPRQTRVVASNIVESQIAQKVTVGEFELVVWDHKANRVVEKVPEFKLVRDETTRLAIAQQVSDGNTADFTTVTAGFAGMVAGFEKLPASLNRNDEKNDNHVPALSFEVTQIYADQKFYNAPTQPALHMPPNAYQSQCVPYWPKHPFCYNSKKRQTGPDAACNGEEKKFYQKKFILFSKEGAVSTSIGDEYAARLITSFYSGDDCLRDQGLLSIDSEFRSQISATEVGAELALGTWSWDRQFVDGNGGKTFTTRYILGVPGSFSKINEFFDKGYSTINWHAVHGFDHDESVHKAHSATPFDGICSKFQPTGAAQLVNKYGEDGRFYNAEDGINCAPFDDVVRKSNCGTEAQPDKSLLAFLNDGEILNFNKKESSILIMGKMSAGCNPTPFTETVFDTLTFTGVMPGVEPVRVRERSVLEHDLAQFGLVYDEEAEGLVHALHRRGADILDQPHKRALADVIRDQVATPPNEENFDMRFATGSTDGEGGNSANSGDHPIELFPEIFSAPINIDPQADSDIIVVANVTTGSTLSTCNRGSIGCSCRTTTQACDIGLKCDSNAKCMLKDCKAGDSGCPCIGGEKGMCSATTDKCIGAICATSTQCTAGEPGCECLANKCSGGANCIESLCIMPGNCAAGSKGCVCGLRDMSCDGELECDPVMGACLAKRCKSGAPGCRCNTDTSCDDGFTCNLSLNVCSLFQCPAGDPGCQCTEKRGCKPGFNCVDYSTTGDSRCVATPNNCGVGSQMKRCLAACGAVSNIRACPNCDNGVVDCHYEPSSLTGPCALDPLSEACKDSAGAASVSVAIVAVLAAIVALAF